MQRETQIVLALFRAVETRDLEGLLAQYHDDVEFHDPESLPYGGVMRGKASIREQLESRPGESWIGTWGPLQPTPAERSMDPRVLAVSGAEVTVAYRQRAVSRDGEQFDSPVIGLYEVRDGKVARAQMFHYDTAAIVAFLDRAGRVAAV
jgi:ketosteroid isomerase-like protein